MEIHQCTLSVCGNRGTDIVSTASALGAVRLDSRVSTCVRRLRYGRVTRSTRDCRLGIPAFLIERLATALARPRVKFVHSIACSEDRCSSITLDIAGFCNFDGL